MKVKFIISTILIFATAIQLFGSKFRIVKGVVADDKNEVFIGARIEEYGNGVNYVDSDINGEFEIIIPTADKVILRVTYGCSAFYDVLFEVKPDDKYVRVEAFTKKADRNTKKIRRRLNRLDKEKEDNTFFIRLEAGINTNTTQIRSQIIKFELLFPDWNNLKITAYQESIEEANKLLDLAEEELLKVNSDLRIEREIQINDGDNFDRKIVKVKFIREAGR